MKTPFSLSKPRRRKIRERVKEILIGRTAVGDSVFTNTSAPDWKEHLPKIIIRTLSEPVEKFAEAGREYKRDLEVLVEIIVDGQENGVNPERVEDYIEDKLDQIAQEVDTLLLADDTLGCDAKSKKAIADNFEPTSSTFEYVAEGEKFIGSARLVYTATYHELFPANLDKIPGVGDFKEAKVDWHVGHHDSEPDLTETERQDTFEIPQT